jgi:hypothetical protein
MVDRAVSPIIRAVHRAPILSLRHALALVLIVGLATGVLTQFGQSTLPDDWSPIANAISPWLGVAFLVGAAMPDRHSAAIAGATVLVLALVGYYTMTEIRFGIGASTGSVVRWGLGAAIGGPAFGIAGDAWRRSSTTSAAIGVGLLAAAFVAEGAYQAAVVAHQPVGVTFVVVGLGVPLALGRTRSGRLRAYAAAIPALALGALGFVMLTWLDGVAAGIS